LWRKLPASSALGVINHRLRHALAAGDISALVAALADLAASPAGIGSDVAGVREVLVNAGQAIVAIAQGGSVSQLDAAIAACQQVADGAPSPLIKAPFQAWRGILLEAMFYQTHDLIHLDEAISALAQAAETVPETQPARAAYQGRLAKLRGVRPKAAEAKPRTNAKSGRDASSSKVTSFLTRGSRRGIQPHSPPP